MAASPAFVADLLAHLSEQLHTKALEELAVLKQKKQVKLSVKDHPSLNVT